MPETTATTATTGAPDADRRVSGASLELQEVTKRYPGQQQAAVDAVSLDIAAGEKTAFVGPSGCGKTTLLKMLNRLVEPTSGRILIDGRDTAAQDADELRRGIGYVIQAGGLFPHMTVAANTALVPRMLGWGRRRTEERVAELLELVGLDPGTYASRYPRELSGGQQQRVGVARALAADPPVLLMDEPFGAVDPVTRQRLQDEVLRIHEELGKTIVFVTHDIDEAVKLGDRIVVFDTGARVVQHDTPARILAQPAEQYVADFVGAGATLKALTLTRVGDVELVQVPTATAGEDAAAVVARARAGGHDFVVVVDERGRPTAWPSTAELAVAGTVPSAVDARLPVVGWHATLNDALDAMLAASQGGVVVTGQRGTVIGVVAVETVMAAIQRTRAEVVG